MANMARQKDARRRAPLRVVVRQKEMKALHSNYQDIFPGAVPGWLIFGMQVDDICAGLASCHPSENDSGPKHLYLPELSFIGMVAYFEGFIRYHFASLVNVCPKLMSNFAAKRPDIFISINDLAQMDTLHGTIGFLLADTLNFTSSKDINSNFRDLCMVTPFSREDCAKYDSILHDRHQIVHSAGMYTTKYLRGRVKSPSDENVRPYLDSVIISTQQALDFAEFAMDIAEKLVKSTYNRLIEPNNWHSDEEMMKMASHLCSFVWSKEAFQ